MVDLLSKEEMDVLLGTISQDELEARNSSYLVGVSKLEVQELVYATKLENDKYFKVTIQYNDGLSKKLSLSKEIVKPLNKTVAIIQYEGGCLTLLNGKKCTSDISPPLPINELKENSEVMKILENIASNPPKNRKALEALFS